MYELLALLSDGTFHSGERLGEVLGVSRSAVWKRLLLLEESTGLRIHKVRGKGYRLEQSLILLDGGRLKRDLPYPVMVLAEVDSTNAEALRHLAANKVDEPLLFVAEQQAAGRGRRGRSWVSPYGVNLYFSLLLPVADSSRLEGLSLLVGLAVRRGLVACGYPDVELKWPNDLLLSGGKVAGILLELAGDPADSCHVVVGVGINVNMRGSQAGIDQSWSSLVGSVVQPVDRNLILIAVMRSMHELLSAGVAGRFSVCRAEWEAAHAWQGRAVCLSTGPQSISGVVLGVDDRGALRLMCEGEERVYSGGELSLRLSDDS